MTDYAITWLDALVDNAFAKKASDIHLEFRDGEVPFKLEVVNKISVMLGEEKVPALGFTFTDGTEQADVERDKLMGALSTGERKAFYVLNVMFDMRVRMESGQKTLFVVDDIADSFDYKNKYAIIQYLSDISAGPTFKQIILTHNFDFFRTACERRDHRVYQKTPIVGGDLVLINLSHLGASTSARYRRPADAGIPNF